MLAGDIAVRSVVRTYVPDRTAMLTASATAATLRRVIVDPAIPADARPYALLGDDALRTLPLPGGGSRSLYGPDGIVVGRRHFDEAFLPDRYFTPGTGGS